MTISGACCRQIPLKDISFDLRWNLHPWSADNFSSELSDSWAINGIHHPPYLLERDTTCFEILAGHRRCHYAKLRQQQTIWAQVIPATTEKRVLLEVLLCDQHLARPLSLAEKARFVAICNDCLAPKEWVATYLERLQLQRLRLTPAEFNRLLCLDREILTAIDEGRIQDKMAVELLRLDDSLDQVALVRLFHQLQLGDNQQRKIFAALRDLCRRMQVSIAAYLESPEIAAILTSPTLNAPQKVQHLGNRLLEQLNPELTRTEKAFTNRVNELRLPPQLTLQHCQAFETDAVDLIITFPSISACTAVLPEISKLLTKTS